MVLRALILAVVLVLLSSPARAAHPRATVTLSYVSYSTTQVTSCPDRDFFDNEIQVRVGYSLVQSEAPKHLSVKLDRARGEFHAATKLTDDQGHTLFEEVFSDRECTAAVLHAAVAVSIRFAQPPEPPPPRPPLEAPRPALVSAPAPATLPAPPRERLRFQLGLGSVFSLGTAPVVMGGVDSLFGARYANVSGGLDVRALGAPSVTVGRGRASYLFGSLSGSLCLHFLRWGLGCGRLEAGFLSTRDGVNVHSIANRVAFFGAGMRLGGDIPLTTGLALRPYVELLFVTTNTHLRDTRLQYFLWTSPPASAAFGFGPVITF